jgi:hypothetical protein
MLISVRFREVIGGSNLSGIMWRETSDVRLESRWGRRVILV